MRHLKRIKLKKIPDSKRMTLEEVYESFEGCPFPQEERVTKYTGYKYSPTDEAWKREHTTRIVVRLNHNTDADVLERIRAQKSMGGYIKRLVREDIARNP